MGKPGRNLEIGPRARAALPGAHDDNRGVGGGRRTRGHRGRRYPPQDPPRVRPVTRRGHAVEAGGSSFRATAMMTETPSPASSASDCRTPLPGTVVTASRLSAEADRVIHRHGKDAQGLRSEHCPPLSGRRPSALTMGGLNRCASHSGDPPPTPLPAASRPRPPVDPLPPIDHTSSMRPARQNKILFC